jgi:hypothetical protein
VRASPCRAADEDYLNSANKRFAKPFVSDATARLRAKGVDVPEPSHDHGHH